MSNKQFFITAIDTDIGKTIVSAILTEALKANYWKPVQAGNLDNTDTHRVRQLVNNKKSYFHSEGWRLPYPMSPHASAEKAGINIVPEQLHPPDQNGPLIIEGAGGIMVPLTRQYLLLHLMKKWQYPVIIVVSHYLGSINHTLLSIELLRKHQVPVAGLIYNGPPHPSSESAIKAHTQTSIIGRVPPLSNINISTINRVAKKFRTLIEHVP